MVERDEEEIGGRGVLEAAVLGCTSKGNWPREGAVLRDSRCGFG